MTANFFLIFKAIFLINLISLHNFRRFLAKYAKTNNCYNFSNEFQNYSTVYQAGPINRYLLVLPFYIIVLLALVATTTTAISQSNVVVVAVVICSFVRLVICYFTTKITTYLFI